MEQGLTKQQVITVLTRSPHGVLTGYLDVMRACAKEDAEFAAHLVSWNEIHGSIRDSKVALPVASLIQNFPFVENSLAHMALLDPRNLVRAIRFGKTIGTPGYGNAIEKMVERYIRVRESKVGRFERAVLTHRASMKSLCALSHLKLTKYADDMLFKGKRYPGSSLEAVANLKNMSGLDAAGAIMQHRLPFLTVVSALGNRANDTDFVLALINSMSPAELVTNTKMLEKLGVKTVPALRSAYEAGLQKVAAQKTVSLKVTRAAEAMTDSGLKDKLVAAQEKQIAGSKGIEGNWLVLADKSGSMQAAIEAAVFIAAGLAKMVKGEVRLVFFDSTPRAVDVTGKTYDEIKEMTKHVTAVGNTSIGCGVQHALDCGWDVSGIAVVTDGGENAHPMFAPAYRSLCKALGRDVPVYLYLLKGQSFDVLSTNCNRDGIALQTYDLRGGVDFYSLPNLVQTMRASRYSLIDDIMGVPLRTLDEVFSEKEMNRELAA
jgi:hypothetical protein